MHEMLDRIQLESRNVPDVLVDPDHRLGRNTVVAVDHPNTSRAASFEGDRLR